MFFLDGDAADVEEDRLLAEAAHLAQGGTAAVSTPRDQRISRSKPRAWELVLDRLRGDEGAGGAVVEISAGAHSTRTLGSAAAPRHIRENACDSSW